MSRSPFPNHVKTIAVVAPAGPMKRRAVQQGVTCLSRLGLKVIQGKYVFAGSREKYLSASIEQRLADLHAAWDNEAIDAVLCTRGGYGCGQLLPHIDWTLLRRRNLPCIGFSDISALHLGMLSQRVDGAIAGPTLSRYPQALESGETVSSLRHALSNGDSSRRKKLKAIKPGKCSGRLIASNLTVLCSLLGTKFLPSFKGSILVLEDINEPTYAVDRFLNQLVLAGILASCAGLVFGGFTDCGSGVALQRAFTKYADYVDGPVLSGLRYGHFLPFTSLRCGATASIDGEYLVF